MSRDFILASIQNKRYVREEAISEQISEVIGKSSAWDFDFDP